MDVRMAANAVAETLAEDGEAPEGILYAGLMTMGGSLEEFQAVQTFLLVAGLAEEAPGPVLVATPRLRRIYKSAMSKLAETMPKGYDATI